MVMREAVRKLRADQLPEAEGTPGLNRRVAFEAHGHWFGHVEAEPETMSGWHHHGDNVTIGYVLKGKISLEFGRRGAGRGQRGRVLQKVPRRLVHREGNMSTETGEIILARVGEGPVVFPVEGPDPA